MATSKSHTERTTVPPPQILLSDRLLASRISLPPEPCISYVKFCPSADASLRPHESIEAARRFFLEKNAAVPLLESFLTSVQIGNTSLIYVFRIDARHHLSEATSTLSQLHFDGLTVIEASSFSPQDIYPCSAECSILPNPCPSCIDYSSSPSSTFPPTPISLLPRKPLRNVYSHFLEAVRIRLLDDIASTPATKTYRHAKRLKGGFLLSPLQTNNEWGSNWEYRTSARSLVYCQLQVYLSRDPSPWLIVYPHIIQTPFLPFTNTPSLPAGTPITLLPHATPAFFLTHYTGPTSALVKQFRISLQGMGVDGWDCPSPSPEPNSTKSPFAQNAYSKEPAFIIAWINVENKQGEDKGIVVIYPIALCLSFGHSSSFSHFPTIPSRQPLNYIPDLPAPLQPSPHIPPITSSTLPLQRHSRTGTPIPHPGSPADSTPLPFTSSSAPFTFPSRLPYPSSPTSNTLHTFRTLTLSKSKSVSLVASEVGGYVDAVARERERERERLKRERESIGVGGSTSASPRLARTVVTTPAPPPTTIVAAPAVDTPIQVDVVATQTNSQTTFGTTAPGSSNQLPSQNFYPSPPQTNPPTVAAQTSPSVEMTPASAPELLATTSTSSTVPATTSNTSYDPFGNIDSTWSEPQPTYLGMDMDMDFDMGFGMNMNMAMGSSRSGAGAYNNGSGMDFEDAFTDDDFSFFDQPSRTTVAAPLPAMGTDRPGSGLTPSVNSASLGIGMSPPTLGDMHTSGPGPPQHTPAFQSHSMSTWTPNTLGEGFTPHSTDGTNLVPPDLLPPSPGQTPYSHSAPATPSVHIEHDSATIQRPGAGSDNSGSYNGASMFDPIPFSPYHREADGKYAIGKFALPSPPDEEDRTEPLRFSSTFFPSPSSTTRAKINDWRSKYAAATDPRIGVVRKLKRKMIFEQGGRELGPEAGRNIKASPAWMRELEDCIVTEDEQDDDINSEVESEEEDDFADIDDSPIVSRPSTPPPAYLPLGPTLIQTHFQHSQLLPLSTPLRPPGAAVAPINIVNAASVTSVPTPVSPAATMGAASEKSKSLEAAAFTVATEVVENHVWAEAWRASTLGSRIPTEVWSADVRTIAQVLEAVPSLEGPLDVGTLFDVHSKQLAGSTSVANKGLQALEAPMISIGKGDAIIQILPTALRFWEKLGLGPKAGKKNGTSFVLFEPDGEQRQQQVETWLSTVATTYESKHLGKLLPGTSNHCTKDGLVPIRFDSSFRKTLASFVASLPAIQSSVVFFVVTPIPIMTLTSPILRQVFSAIKKALKTYSEARILFQLIPEQLTLGSMSNPTANFSDLDILCTSVYNRILVPVERNMSRRFFEHGERVIKHFQEPALTLARPIHSKVTFVNAPHASLDVMDRYTFMHVGYHLSPCGKWILAACVDQRGEAHDLGVWLTQTPGEEDSEAEISEDMFLIKKVWDFAVQFSKRANIEWRLVISKLGIMTESELLAWTTFLDTTLASDHGLPKIHATLLSVEPDAPWTFIPAKSKPQIKHKPSPPTRSFSSSTKNQHSLFTDMSSTIYALPPSTHLPVFSPPSPTDLGLSLSYVCEPPSTSEDTYPHPLPLLPLSSTTLVRVPAPPSSKPISMLHIHLLHTISHLSSMPFTPEEIPQLHTEITHNFHDLAVLAGSRWKLTVNPLLPFHLAAVEAMRIALDRDRGGIDVSDN